MDNLILLAAILLVVWVLFFNSRNESYKNPSNPICTTGGNNSQCTQYGYYNSPEPPLTVDGQVSCAAGCYPSGSGYDTEVYGGTPPTAGGCRCEKGKGCGLNNLGQIQCLPRCRNDGDCPSGISCCGANKGLGVCSIQCS